MERAIVVTISSFEHRRTPSCSCSSRTFSNKGGPPRTTSSRSNLAAARHFLISIICLLFMCRSIRTTSATTNNNPCEFDLIASGSSCRHTTSAQGQSNLIDLGDVEHDEQCLTKTIQEAKCSDFVFTNGNDVCKCVASSEECDVVGAESGPSDTRVYQWNNCMGCRDNVAPGVTGNYDVVCDWFTEGLTRCEFSPDYFDNGDFVAATMCCACGGGLNRPCRNPIYANPGNCSARNWIASGSQCTPSCNFTGNFSAASDYDIMGTTVCENGTLTSLATCQFPAPCNASRLVLESPAETVDCGDEHGFMSSLTSCAFTCPGMLVGEGSIDCEGSIMSSTATCTRAPYCKDGDIGDGQTDAQGYSCADYTIGSSFCGAYDSESFTADELCCSCGGGQKGVCTALPVFDMPGTCSGENEFSMGEGASCVPNCAPGGIPADGFTRCASGRIVETASCPGASCNLSAALPRKTYETYELTVPTGENESTTLYNDPDMFHVFGKTVSRLAKCTSDANNESYYSSGTTCDIECAGPFMIPTRPTVTCENGSYVKDIYNDACAYSCQMSKFWGPASKLACQYLATRVWQLELEYIESGFVIDDVFTQRQSLDLGFSGLVQIHGPFSNETKYPLKWFPAYLRILELNNNFIDSGALGCHNFNAAVRLETLVLASNQLTRIEDCAFVGLESSLTSLDLSSNQITDIGVSIAGLSSLFFLSLKNNRLEAVDGYSFRGLSMLTNLELTGNMLNVVANDTFKTLSSLDQLHLASNPYVGKDSNLVLGVFDDSSQLTYLNLNEMAIPEIRPYLFRYCRSVRTLLVNYNAIAVIGPNALYGLADLRILEVRSNVLMDFPDLSNVPTIEKVRLGNNNIARISPGSLDGLDKLTDLSLEENPLQSIDAGTFDNLPSLRKLSLRNTQVVEIEPGVFSALCGKQLTSRVAYSNHFMLDWYQSPSYCQCVGFVSAQYANRTSECHCSEITTSSGGGDGCALMTPTRTFTRCANRSGDIACFETPVQDYQCDLIASSALADIEASTEGGDLIVIQGIGDIHSGRIVLRVEGSAQITECLVEPFPSSSMFLNNESWPAGRATWTCPLPPAVGAFHKLELEYGSVENHRLPMVSLPFLHGCVVRYAAPKIVSVSGCGENGCRRMGGDSITIDGYNFGAEGALVFVNGLRCHVLTHVCDAEEPAECHRRLTCNVPPLVFPQGERNYLVVVQSNQNNMNTNFFYHRCGVDEVQTYQYTDINGKIGQKYVGCHDCPYGRNSDGEEDVISCLTCDLLFLGSNRCDVPVFGIIAGVLAIAVLGAISRVAYKRWRTMSDDARRLAGIISKQKVLIRARATDISLMGQAWKVSSGEIEFERELASGAYGKVFLGALRGKWRVAIKVLKSASELTSNGKGDLVTKSPSTVSSTSSTLSSSLSSPRSIFEEAEIRFLIRTRHERLVMFLGAGHLSDGGSLFICSEYMEGGSLDKYLWDAAFYVTWIQRLQMLRDVVGGLSFLHCVHRALHLDIKSPNILLSSTFARGKSAPHDVVRAKIADFGLAKLVTHGKRRVHRTRKRGSAGSKSRDHMSASSSWVTENMIGFLGTLQWMAPEMMHETGATYGPSADIYSVGILLWETLARRKPWSGVGVRDIQQRVRAGERPPVPSTGESRAHPDYVALMHECWEQKYSARPLINEIDERLHGIMCDVARDESAAMLANDEGDTKMPNAGLLRQRKTLTDTREREIEIGGRAVDFVNAI